MREEKKSDGDRARRNGRRKGRGRRGTWDEQPRREGLRRHGSEAKSLGEGLGPLRRFLLSRVGRPWDKVFSEVCTRLDQGYGSRGRLRDRLDYVVVTHVVLIDGVPCHGGGNSRGRYGQPIASVRGRTLLYVCPKTGLLRRAKEPRTPVRREAAERPARVKVSATLQCHFLDGTWHLVTVAPLPQGPRKAECHKLDVVLDRRACDIDPQEAVKVYGAAVFATSKRRLTRRELRRWPIPADA